MKKSDVRLAILLSGGGTTAEAVLSAIKRGGLKNVVPVCVISSKPQAGGIEKAKKFGVKVFVLDRSQLPGDDCFGKVLRATLKLSGVNLVSQNGWLPLTSDMVVDEYRGRIINQHPGPLDPGRTDFGGKGMFGARVTCARIAYSWITDSDYWTESTVHYVTEEYDKGEVIRSERLSLPAPSRRYTFSDLEKEASELIESTNNVQKELLPLEHNNVIAVLQSFADGTVSVESRKKPLVPPQHEQAVWKVKKLAARLFPGG